MPGKIFYSIGARGGVLMCAMVLAASILVSCAPWYQAYDIGSDEDLTKLSVVPELRKALRDEDPDVRMQAAMAIKRMGPDAKDAIPDLVDTLDDDDYDVRREAANAIEALLGISDKKEKKDKDKEGGKDLSDEGRDLMVMVYMNRLESKDWMTRRDAANHLAQMGPDAAKAVPALVAAMMDESDWGRLYNEVRRSSARALGEMRYEARAANPALIKASTFHDYDVRLEAVKALGKIGPKSEATVIEALKVALKDSDFDVRREAANALGGFEVYADSTVPNLVKALSDMDFDVRREAAKSLGRIGPKTDAAVEALLKTTNDADADVRQAAVEALANVQPEDRAKVLPVVLLKLDDMDEDVRMTAVRTIAKFRAGDAGTLAALERVGHEDQSFTVKKAALETLYVLKGVETGERVADTKAKSPVRKVAASSGSRTADRTPAQTIHATVDALNIRELPSVSSRRVGKLHRNETASVIETQDEWLKIRKSDGVTGYVFWEYTSFEPGTEDTGAGESTTVPEAGAATVSVPAVSSPAVVPTPPPAAAVAPAAAAVTVPAVAMIRSTVDVLNMRSVPDVKGSKVGRVMPGETATVLETRGDWLKIQKPDGVTGYVAREYTQVISEAGASAAVATATAIVAAPVTMIRSTADVLNMRSVPAVKGSKVGRLMPGETATVLETRGDWLKIQKPDGVTGYVAREYTEAVPQTPPVMEDIEAPVPQPASIIPPVSVKPEPVETVASTPGVQKIRSTSESLSIRTEPYGNKSVGQLGLNEEVEVVETLAEWIKIKKPDGTTGYVPREYTAPVNN